MSLFCACWITNTIRKVTMVVPVLMTSCQVSEKPNTGPVAAQITITSRAAEKVQKLPAAWLVLPATLANSSVTAGASFMRGILAQPRARVRPAPLWRRDRACGARNRLGLERGDDQALDVGQAI